MKQLNESIICAGFGGQGIMMLGKILANSGMEEGLNVTYMPSYGAEVRGGTAHSMVRISSESIGNPVVTSADTLVIMNEPSMEKFSKKIKKNGFMILNDSLIKKKSGKNNAGIMRVKLTDEAIRLGNIRVANMIAAGIYCAKKGIISKKSFLSVIRKMAKKKKELIDINIRALERGIELVNSEQV